MHLALAVGIGGRIPSFIEVIVNLINASCAGFAYLASVGLKFGDSGRVCVIGGKLVVERFMRFKRLTAPDTAFDLSRRLRLHRIGDMAVVQLVTRHLGPRDSRVQTLSPRPKILRIVESGGFFMLISLFTATQILTRLVCCCLRVKRTTTAERGIVVLKSNRFAESKPVDISASAINLNASDRYLYSILLSCSLLNCKAIFSFFGVQLE